MVIFDSFEATINVMSAKDINNYYIFYIYDKKIYYNNNNTPRNDQFQGC